VVSSLFVGLRLHGNCIRVRYGRGGGGRKTNSTCVLFVARSGICLQAIAKPARQRRIRASMQARWLAMMAYSHVKASAARQYNRLLYLWYLGVGIVIIGAPRAINLGTGKWLFHYRMGYIFNENPSTA
jgi:hypothetical protein